MLNSRDQEAGAALVDMAQGYFRGKVLCAAVRLGIADALADGEKPVDELAAATGAPADSLHRLLRALAGIGIVEEVGPRRFRLTALGEPLRKDAPHSVWASIVFWADLLADLWTYLPECVRAGGNAGAMGAMQRQGVTSRWSRESDAQAIFHTVFAEPTADRMASFAAAYPFADCRGVADLGGAGGGLLAAILLANPHLRGILVDRKEAVQGAAPRLAAAGLTERCELVTGDLLESVPAGADVYIMKSLLHGYADADAQRILRNCHAATTPEARLLVIEAVLPVRIDRADPAVERLAMSDLNMLIATGGRERSRAEWESLLASGGFELRRIIAVPGGDVSMIEAAPR